MATAMYGLLMTSPFRLPTVPGPLVIYYPPPMPIVDAAGEPVLDAAGMPMYRNQPTTLELNKPLLMRASNESKQLLGVVYDYTTGGI